MPGLRWLPGFRGYRSGGILTWRSGDMIEKCRSLRPRPAGSCSRGARFLSLSVPAFCSCGLSSVASSSLASTLTEEFQGHRHREGQVTDLRAAMP